MSKQIPSGYKQTKLGIIPEDWEVMELKQLLSQDIQNGYSPVCPEDDTGHWILGLGALTQQNINLNEKKPAPLNDNKVKNFILKRGDFLISRSNTPDRVGFSGLFRWGVNNYSYPDLMMRFRINENLINLAFCDYSLKSKQIMNYLKKSASGTSPSMVKINKAVIEEIIFAIPAIREQEKIAGILSTWDDVIIKQEKLIEQKKIFKKSMMQKIFSQKIRFKDDNGNDYLDWKEKKLGDIGKIVTGKTPRTNDEALWHGNICFVTPTDINGDKYQIVTARTVKGNGLVILPTGSIMFTCIASIGKMSISTAPSITNQQINSIIVEKHNNEFIYYAMVNISEYIKSTQSNTTFPIINKTEFSQFIIHVPYNEEQNKIANFLSSIDDEITKQKKVLEQLMIQKKALMQKLLTGQVRVKL